jgi:choline dehydrogenase
LFGLATHDCPQGTIELASTDPSAAPVVDLGYADVIRAGLFEQPWNDFQSLLGTSSYQSVGARDVKEGVALAERMKDSIGGGTHGAGGCCIGDVVDADLRVYGIEGLSVADTSVFPYHVSNNPNFTCFAIGEAAAVKVRAGLGASADTPATTP